MACIAKIILILALLCSPVSAENLRVISLYPGHSDNIFAMGGKDILIALSENDDEDLLPELPRISLRTGAEKVLALKPDIVVTRSFAMKINPNLYEVLENAGVKILCLDPPEFNEFDDYLKTLATSLSLHDIYPYLMEDSAASESGEGNRETVEGLYHRKPKVFVEATGREIHTCSPNSWAANLIFMAGGINIAKDAEPLRKGSSISAWGVERVLKSLDDLDIYIIQTGAMNNTTLENFYNREWTKALKDRNIKVYEIPERFLSRPSLIGREKALKELTKIFNEWKSEN
ncbi:MAG: ABC transporter substrate-binding protein [Synergistaceae bacterium]|nr:ABC transporter substrate-binding protein [Synergistaceae bacterium]MBQ6737498.1 ABC transporter substrate-binding protein [Synergistaceae bacterium]